MRLADFISANVEPILCEWEAFARSLPAGGLMDRLGLRDHAQDILRATALNMKSAQTEAQEVEKSKGEGTGGTTSARLNAASVVHAGERVKSGFDLLAVIAEYRALRASVIRLWRASKEVWDSQDLDDITRFHESMDQSLTKAVTSFTERVERSRLMFLAILSHDLRNPLAAISMSAQLLQTRGNMDKDTERVVAGIANSAGAMGQMIKDLFAFTSGGLGVAMPISPGRMDLGPLCLAVVEEIRAVNPGREVECVCEGDLTGEWDGARLRQLISNLLANAVQHGETGGRIEVRVAGEDAEVVLRVRNGGAVIPAGALATIFDPLVRGSAGEGLAPTTAGSVGLGLYIAREVAGAHGGRIEVASSVEGGTVFTVRLPRGW